MTILSLAKDIADDLSLQRPNALFATYDEGDTSDRKIVRALTKTAKYLAAAYDWQVLRAEKTHTVIDGEAQTGAIPSDMLRIIQDTMWLRGIRRKVEGPFTPQEWAEIKSGLVRPVFVASMIRANVLYLTPTNWTGNTLAFEYITTAIGTNAGGTRIAAYGADTDVPLWDDELMTLGAIMQFRKAERMDYAQDQKDFEQCMADRIKMDGNRRVLKMGGGEMGMTADERLSRMKQSVVIAETS